MINALTHIENRRGKLVEDYINVVLIGKGCEAYFKLMKDIKKMLDF